MVTGHGITLRIGAKISIHYTSPFCERPKGSLRNMVALPLRDNYWTWTGKEFKLKALTFLPLGIKDLKRIIDLLIGHCQERNFQAKGLSKQDTCWFWSNTSFFASEKCLRNGESMGISRP